MIDCYKSEPLEIIDGIRVFSKTDFYVENYDAISNDHLSHYEKTGENPFMREDHWLDIEKSTEVLVEKYTKHDNLKILDVGVGMGRLLERFPNLKRFGMDISMGYLKCAQDKGIDVCMSRIEEMPYSDEYFDVVTTTDVLEHVFDLNDAVKKILAVLKCDGVLIVRVPYKEDLSSYLDPACPYEFIHLRSFDEFNLIALFEKIFNVKVLEWTFSGRKAGLLKVGNDFRYYAGAVRRLLLIVRWLNGRLYDYLTNIVCRPVEINMVIRKVHRSER